MNVQQYLAELLWYVARAGKDLTYSEALNEIKRLHQEFHAPKHLNTSIV